MIQMVENRNDPSEGWGLETTLEPEHITVYSRQVEWSKAPHLRSHADTRLGVRAIFEVQRELERISHGAKSQEQQPLSQAINSAVDTNASEFRNASSTMSANRTTVYHAVSSGYCAFIEHRVVPFAWPLSPRDLVYVGAYVLLKHRNEDAMSGYVMSLDHRRFANLMPGLVRATVRYQGLVALPGGKLRGSTLTVSFGQSER